MGCLNRFTLYVTLKKAVVWNLMELYGWILTHSTFLMGNKGQNESCSITRWRIGILITLFKKTVVNMTKNN
jgi:hypothetical protein